MKRIFFDQLLDGFDDSRPKLGRVSMEEEALIRRLFNHDPLADFRKFLGTRKNPAVPAYRSSRPKSPEGHETFVFSVKSWNLAGGKTKRYCVGDSAIARQAGLRYSKGVKYETGQGAWQVRGRVPPGMREVGNLTRVSLKAGGAALFQGYIERDGAVEYDGATALSFGNIHEDGDFRQIFWDEVDSLEGPGKRIQTRIIAELPFEKEIGPQGRAIILQNLGKEIERLGLPWHGVVHLPEKQSDPRNFHLHILFHDRPLSHWNNYDIPVFSRAKSVDVRGPGFVGHLRKRYAEIVNREFERAGIERHWDPRRYEEMGILKEPQKHLGSSVIALERQGIVTEAGAREARKEYAWRHQQLMARHAEHLSEIERRLLLRIDDVNVKGDKHDGFETPEGVDAGAQYIQSVNRAAGAAIALARARHRKRWFAERKELLLSRAMMLVADETLGQSAKRYCTRVERLYMRFIDRMDKDIARGRALVRDASIDVDEKRKMMMTVNLTGLLNRAEGRIEKHRYEMLELRKREKIRDRKFEQLVEGQEKLLRQRARYRKRLEEGMRWEELEDWAASDQPFPDKYRQLGLDGKAIARLIAEMKRTARQIERVLDKGALAENEGSVRADGPVSALASARKEKADIIREIRSNNLVEDVETRLGRKLNARWGRRPRQAAVSGK